MSELRFIYGLYKMLVQTPPPHTQAKIEPNQHFLCLACWMINKHFLKNYKARFPGSLHICFSQ
jgi:hypothetical protein